MSFDGLFLHYLILDFQPLINGRINKIIQPNNTDLVIEVRTYGKTNRLFISVDMNSGRCNLTQREYHNPESPYPFCLLLRKTIERGIIEEITQIDNDRILSIRISSYDELGDKTNYTLIFEAMGRNANIILVNTIDFTIVDSIRKFLPSAETIRSIIPKAIYRYPDKVKTINPFDINDEDTLVASLRNLEGISPLGISLFNHEINHNQPILKYFKDPILSPTLYQGQKKRFYLFDLPEELTLNTRPVKFESLSLLLEAVFDVKKETTNDSEFLIRDINRELSKLKQKILNLQNDLKDALIHQNDKKIGLLLQSCLTEISPKLSEITVTDYENNEPTTIKLDPTLDGLENMQRYFTKYKKAKNAIDHIEEQLKITSTEINYLESILVDIKHADKGEIQEIKEHLSQSGYQKLIKKTNKFKHKMKIHSYSVDDIKIYVGKNHLQNSYLSHQLADRFDYWFHVKDAPGAHVILKTDQLSEKLIRTCAHLASLSSGLSESSTVAVDYTQVKNLKKVPGCKGYFVTYTNQKTIYIDPDSKTLESLLDKK